MRFHLIDRIESWEPMQRITARKVTSARESYWQHGESGPAMPFGMALESLCQAGAWLVLLSSDHRLRAALLTVGEVTMHRDIVPGDTVRLHAEVVSIQDNAAVVDGYAEVAGQKVLDARNIMCALIDAERLDDPADTARMAGQLLGEGPIG
ncbi:hypothetical protein [Nocardia sp. NPDC058497]|uniref:hypothetical protein n=1 Tax=Nocardia sp. NPDC058497 TaxID=3346529 RepID=UPI00364D3711